MDERVRHYLVLPFCKLRPRGQLPENQKEGHFQERGLLSQLLDRNAPVLQDALVSVNEADLARARNRVHEPRVVAPQDPALLVLYFFKLVRLYVVVLYRDFVAFTRAVVGY